MTLLIAAPHSFAQQPELETERADEVEAVVVTARRIGVPVWRVGDHLILVGHIQAVPKGTRWRPEELGKAISQADAVVLPHAEPASPADVARMMFRIRSLFMLPKGKTLRDFVDEPTLARVEPFHDRGVVSRHYSRTHPWLIADDLLESVGYDENSGPDLADIMRQEAKRQRKPNQIVGTYTGRKRLDAFFNEGPAAHVPCLQAALNSAEAPNGVKQRRIDDYVSLRVPAVVNSPLEGAFSTCWLTGAPESIATQLSADWRTRLNASADGPGVTLAVVPLSILAQDGGVLDAFAAQGVQVDGPRWRD